MNENKLIKSNFLDLVVIAMRLLLAFTFLNYGWSKLTDSQFGNLTPEELATPIKDLSLFKISWFIFDYEPFKSFIGIFQIIASLLILFRRTTVLGVFILIPIILNILILDIMIMPPSMKSAFVFRLSFYLFFCFYILYQYKKDLLKVFKILTVKRNFIKHKYWKYLFVPLLMILLEIISSIFNMLYYFIIEPELITQYFKSLF
nr:hypothetical protein [uncultured Flavobacterium sp.]